MTAVRELVYRITPPKKKTVDDVLDSLVPAAKKMMVNKWLMSMTIDVEEDHLMLMVTMKGHDQWWIKRRAPFLIVSVLTNADLTAGDARLIEIKQVTNSHHARFWEGGKRNVGKRIHIPADGSKPPPKVIYNCKNCPPPKQFHDTRSGWHHDYRGQGR